MMSYAANNGSSENAKVAMPTSSMDSNVTHNQKAGLPADCEKAAIEEAMVPDKVSAFRGLGWLDRFLAAWILLAMAIGIILGNFVPNTGPALQKGKFVGVSIPIGEGISSAAEDRR